jgi:hypothetical protein
MCGEPKVTPPYRIGPIDLQKHKYNHYRYLQSATRFPISAPFVPQFLRQDIASLSAQNSEHNSSLLSHKTPPTLRMHAPKIKANLPAALAPHSRSAGAIPGPNLPFNCARMPVIELSPTTLYDFLCPYFTKTPRASVHAGLRAVCLNVSAYSRRNGPK